MTVENVKDTAKEINNLTQALDQFSTQAVNNGVTFQTIEASFKAVGGAANTFTSQLVGVATKLDKAIAAGTAGQGVLATSAGLLGKGIQGLISGIGGLGTVFGELIEGTDALTAYNRKLTASLFETTSAFGMGLDATRKYGDYITSNARDFASAEYGFISSAERIGALKAMGAAGIPLDMLSKTVNSTAGSFDFLNLAILQSESLGMELSTYMSNMSSLMNKQGMDTQQAAEQMAEFGDVAERTGLKVSTVSTSLTSFADRFSKLGMSASFGRPVLEGFTNSLKSMGLGFENAVDLAGTLNDSIAGLTSNYAMAYLTFQRGGLDLGGGGTVLGASIGMRASLLDSEKRGEQGDMGLQIAGAIKETIASYTGGEIITVTQAAENPEMQQAFYTQTKLLESMYGISDTATQDRTLELLQQINDATESGDKDLADSLGKDLNETIEMRDKTLGVQEKIAKYTEGLFAELQYTHRDLVDALDGVISAQVDLGTDMISGAAEGADPSLRRTGRRASDAEGYRKILEESTSQNTGATTNAVNQDQTTTTPGGTTGATNPAPSKLEEVVTGLTNAVSALVDQLIADRSGR